MSGVRIHNDELRNLGMTLPGFIERGKVIASLPSLGILTLAGHTPEGWEIDYLEIDALNDETMGSACSQAHNLVAISCLTARIYDAYRLADQLRQQGKTVIIGGLHASVLPDEVALHAGVSVVGEGEAVWGEILSDYLASILKPRYTAKRQPAFTPWAVPRYDLLDPDKYNRITIQTTRGCPLDCSFCAASRMISGYKRKSIPQVEQELDAIEAIWPRPFIELADDNTFVNKKWSRQLVEAIGKRKAKWFTESDISLADDEALLKDLAASGCVQVLIGLEATEESALDETDSRHWKRRRRSQYVDAIQKIQDHGVSVNGCFIFGFDTHTPDVFESTARFIEDANLAEVQLTILTPFPGTELHRKLESEGRLLAKTFWDKCTLFDVTYQPKQMSPDQLTTGFRDLVKEVYSPTNTDRRKARFRECVRKAKTHV